MSRNSGLGQLGDGTSVSNWLHFFSDVSRSVIRAVLDNFKYLLAGDVDMVLCLFSRRDGNSWNFDFHRIVKW